MSTVCIQIGNSDNKLTQEDWSQFIADVNEVISLYGDIHFAGGSSPEKPWQNYCWVFNSDNPDTLELIRQRVEVIKHVFKQESVAWLEGTTIFV